MSWIKRNLYFVIGGLVALGMMGYGGFYLYSQYGYEQKVIEEIKGLYDELARLSKMPFAGKVDVIKQLKDDTARARDLGGKLSSHFPSPPPIPNLPAAKLDKREFLHELPVAIAELTSEALQSGVSLPKDYAFTFDSQRRQTSFEAGSLEKYAVRLGEVKALAHVLFTAKINALDGLKRETVSEADANSSDYLEQKTTVTPLGEVTPYEVTFRCFSAELAAVLSGLANSQYCFIVKSINIEHAPAAIGGLADVTMGANPIYATSPMRATAPPGYNSGLPPGYTPPGQPGGYNSGLPGGGAPGGAAPSMVGIDPQTAQMLQDLQSRQASRQPPPMQPPPLTTAARPAPPSTGGGTPLLNEQPLRVILAIQLVKRKPGK